MTGADDWQAMRQENFGSKGFGEMTDENTDERGYSGEWVDV